MNAFAPVVLTNTLVLEDFLVDPEVYLKSLAGREFQSYVFPHCVFHGISILDTNHGKVPARIKRLFPQAEPTLTFLRRSPEGQVEPHFIHTDVDMGDWSAILYLNPNPPEGDGTTFWRHKATGAIESKVPHEFSVFGRQSEGWEVVEHVPAKFNRLLMFPSKRFHSRSIFENWGSDDNARLTQVTFGTGDLFV